MERQPGNDSHEDSSGYTDDYWKLVEGLWGFAPEQYPQRELNESGGYDLVFYDSNYMPVKRVPMAPDGSIDTSREAAQQLGSEVPPQDADTVELPANPPTPEA